MKHYSTNNVLTQIYISGFKLIKSNVTYTLYVDESTRTGQLIANRTNVSIVVGETFKYSDFVIPSEYRPKQKTICSCFGAHPEILHYILTNGECAVYNGGSARTGWDISFIHEWHY